MPIARIPASIEAAGAARGAQMMGGCHSQRDDAYAWTARPGRGSIRARRPYKAVNLLGDGVYHNVGGDDVTSARTNES